MSVESTLLPGDGQIYFTCDGRRVAPKGVLAIHMMSHLSETLELPAELPRIHYDFTLQFTHPALAHAFAYWLRCRGSRTMPTRADLVPSKMRGFIAHVGLIEVRNVTGKEVDYFVRLAGTKIDEVLGPRGQRMLTDGLPPEIAPRWRAQFDHVYKTSRPLRAFGRLAYQNKRWLEVENLYAPLGQDGGPPTMIFFAFGVIGRGRPADQTGR